ncbi:MAG: DUF3095 domain-containing protein [Hyphomicrobiales bacterium]
MTQSSHATASVFDRFERVVDPTLYQPLPEDDLIGMTDVVNSTQAIKDGRYKAVNMAGAAAITAVMNAVPGESFPFVFGGDGATLAVSSRHAAVVRDALARTAAFARDELSLGLRAALIPLSAIRAAGGDVRLAWFQPSPEVRYAMFSGGGLGFAEEAMKAGRFAIEPAPTGQRPDLAGLSCRYMPVASRNGVILSLIVKRVEGSSETEFARAVMEVLSMLHVLDRDGHPVPAEGPPVRWPPQGLELEARASRRTESIAARKLKLWLIGAVSWIILKTGMKVGGFDPVHYRRQTTQNTDFRKFDDGLRMTIDCTAKTADSVERRLGELQGRGVLGFGAFRQKQALVTCIVPDPMHDDHMHFVDGAEGGYALAALMLKKKAAAA